MKPLIKDDLFAHDIGLIVKCDDWEKTGNQILENQEKAEKWNEFTKALDNPNSEHPLWIQSLEAMKIVEQVKKRIEDTDSNIKYYDGLSHYSGDDAHGRACANMNAEKRFCEIKLQSELQKILEVKR